MRPVLLIAWREYKQYVLSRGFLMFLVMFPLIVVLGGVAVSFMEQARPTRAFVVIDEAGGYIDAIDKEIARQHQRESLSAWDRWLAVALDPAQVKADDLPAPFAPKGGILARIAALDAAGGFEAGIEIVRPNLRPGVPLFAAPKRQFIRLDASAVTSERATLEGAAAALRPYLTGERDWPGGGELFAAILIPKEYTGAAGGATAQYWSKNLTDPSLEYAAGRALTATARRKFADSLGVEADALDALADVDAPVEAFDPRDISGAGLQDADRLRTAFIPAALTYMLLVVVFGVGNLLLTNTIEERSNKIVEILLSSVTANQLMIGKLIGIAAVGLTMPAIFLFTGGALALAGGEEAGVARDVLGVLFSSHFIAIYLFYFLCAYAIFAMIFLAIGAMSNSLQDAQSFMGPVMLLVFAPLPFMPMVFQNPNGLVATILTWIPIYTPYAVMMRAAADPPMTEIIGATALMLAFAIFLARIMGRIFRSAILQSAPPKAKDLVRLAKAER
ncbi:MAG: ABC transporter permease [Parvularculaceae bacterium]|nr:ABC transporter permease [Parvularculaceae bacterium]